MAKFTFQDIEQAREKIRPHVLQTPFVPFPLGKTRWAKNLWLKCENLQQTGSFKIRGATHCVLRNLEQARTQGVVAASAGNHAQGVASICQQLGIRSTIVMPTITPHIKVQNTRQFGANVVLEGGVYDESYEHAKELASAQGLLLVHPFRDPDVILGQGSVGLELLEERSFGEVEAVVIPIGGGGLLTGVASALKAKRPDIKIYGVTAANAPATFHSLKRGSPQSHPVEFTLAEGVATKRTDETMLGYLSELVDEVFQVSEETIASGIAVLAEHGKLVVEGCGALALGAVMDGAIPEKNVALIVTGGNVDLPTLSSALQRGMVAQNRLVRLDIMLLDRPGGLATLTRCLAQLNANILQVFHLRETLLTPIGQTRVECLLETRGEDHTKKILEGLSAEGFRASVVQ